MNRPQRIACGLSALLLLLTGCPAPTPAPPKSDTDPPLELEEGFSLLKLADFTAFPAEGEGTWSEQEQRLLCSGETKGYIHTAKAYQNFTLRVDFRYPEGSDAGEKPPNTGVLVYIQEPHQVWPACLEVQGRFDDMANIKSNSKEIALEIEDIQEARQQHRKPVGEWNTLEVVSKDGALTARLNGEVICTSQPTEIVSGPIGLQSEGFPVQFRYLRIRESLRDE